MSQDKIKLGISGESFAQDLLRKKGYQILETNYRSYFGEIDAICVQGDTIVFVEIKCRSNVLFGFPFEAVTKKKIKKIIKTGMIYLQNKKISNRPMRVDIVSIIVSANGAPVNYEILRNVSEEF